MTATPAWPPKSLPRLFVATALSEGVEVELDPGQANYLGNVMRLGVGASLLLFDGASGEWLAHIVEAGRKKMRLNVAQRTRPVEAVPELWLAFAPVKRAQVDWLVEKATELGIARMLPVVTRRTMVERVKGERLRSIATEAAEQCGRTLVPEIAEPVGLDTFLTDRDPARTLYFADESGGAAMASAVTAGPAVILVGPEGGFTPEERATIRAQANVIALTLGPRILRAETAALAAVTGWMALVGDWR